MALCFVASFSLPLVFLTNLNLTDIDVRVSYLPEDFPSTMSKLLSLRISPGNPMKYVSSGGILQTAALPDNPGEDAHATLKMREIGEGATTEDTPATICELHERKVCIIHWECYEWNVIVRSAISPLTLRYPRIPCWSLV